MVTGQQQALEGVVSPVATRMWVSDSRSRLQAGSCASVPCGHLPLMLHHYWGHSWNSLRA